MLCFVEELQQVVFDLRSFIFYPLYYESLLLLSNSYLRTVAVELVAETAVNFFAKRVSV